MSNIKSNIQNILNKTFTDSEKRRIVQTDNSFRFSCPYCLDSTENNRKKRGNLYFENNFYVCYNCSTKKPLLAMLKDFNETLPLDDILTLKKEMRSNKAIKTANMDLSEVGINMIKREDFEKHFGVKKLEYNDPFIKERNIQDWSNMSRHGDDIIIYNMIGEYIIAFTVRRINKKPKYKLYTLDRIYSDWYSQDVESTDFIKVYAPIFNFFNLNFNGVVTILEGPIDASFVNNSISLNGVSRNVSILDTIHNKRWLFDNDPTGRQAASKQLLNGECVFIWNKFLTDFNIPFSVKDVNDVANIRINYINEMSNYFSNKKIDLLYV